MTTLSGMSSSTDARPPDYPDHHGISDKETKIAAVKTVVTSHPDLASHPQHYDA